MSKEWFREAVIYQIYPRSFKDSNGDGIGDLNGVLEKLDYLHELGITAIWFSPIYSSPNADNGYDISDYQSIMKEFGTMEDFDKIVEECRKRNIKVIMDLVVNHSSDEHKWFIESKKSRDNDKSDYYIWADKKNGKEPNNWESFFTGSAWQWCEERQQYYLHLFHKKQPDLNWKCDKLKEEIFSMIEWWIKRGADGFRIDAISYLEKPEGFPDSKKQATHKDGYVMDAEIIITIVFMLILICGFVIAGVNIYFFKYNVQRADLITPAMTLTTLSTAIGMFTVPYVTKLFGKKKAGIITLSMFGLLNLLFFINYKTLNSIPLYFVIIVISGIFNSYTWSLGWSMLPDTIEYAEYKVGFRAEGLIYSMYSFGQKMGMALAGLISGQILAFVGYKANDLQQTQFALDGISFLRGGVPFILCIVSIIIISFYPLTEKKYLQILDELDKRKTVEQN